MTDEEEQYMLGFIDGIEEQSKWIDEHAEEIFYHFQLGIELIQHHREGGDHESCECVKNYLDRVDLMLLP